MVNQAQKLMVICLPAFSAFILLLSSCENSLNDIKKVASYQEGKAFSRSNGVEIIYSDSAKVKARLNAPLMIDFDDAKKPYREMPKGVKIVFFDDDLKEKGTITSDYAILRDKENIMEFRKHVVATNDQGETFKSEELIDDMTNKKLFSTKPVEITMANGNVMQGTGFSSNDSLYPWHIDQSTGVFHVDEKQDSVKSRH